MIGESQNGAFICIDLKSYYASVECAARGLDPLTAKLLVADGKREAFYLKIGVNSCHNQIFRCKNKEKKREKLVE